jgi:tetratricopeptide (TPR) repeat protein
VRVVATTLLVLALASPAHAAKGEGKEKKGDSKGKEAPAAAEPAVDPLAPPAPPERPRQLDRAIKSMDQKQWALASLALHTVLQDAEAAYYHAETHFHLASTLEQLDLPYSALEEYNLWLSATNAEDPLIAKGITAAVNLARRMDAGWMIAPGLSRLDTSLLAEGIRGPAMYWVGAWYYRNQDFAAAAAYLSLVPKKTEYYAEARMIEGITKVRQKVPTEAVAPLQSAMSNASTTDPNDNVRELATLNLARAYYALGNFDRAIELFEQTPRSSPHWFEALYEVSWAYFRLGRLSGALSHLQTVDSPFFKDIYHPDATLLRILIFYTLCKYKDGEVMLDEFTTRHYDIQKGLQTAVDAASKDPEKLFDTLFAWREAGGKGTVDLPVPVKQLFQTDEAIVRIGRYLDGIAKEKKQVTTIRTGWEKSELRAVLDQQLDQRRDEARTAKGKEVLAKLRGMLAVLGTHLGNAELYKVELLTAEKNLYTAGYQGLLLERMAKRKPNPAVPEGYRYWPFLGEYWADELGWYEVNTVNECKEIMKN